MSLFELRDVTVRFGGIVALSEVSLSVEPGQVHGVIGPNGAGKTTLFNVACGFVQPAHGTVLRNGRELGRLRPHHLPRLGMARTLQGLGLFERMSVLENVMVGADRFARTGFWSALFGLPRSARDDRALAERSMAALDRLGAAKYAELPAGGLPYPLRKRVALARALVAEPELLLLDEPASGLSAHEMDELGEVITELSGDTAVLLVEHHMDIVMSVCDMITVLDFGKVIAHGTPDEVRDDPAVLAAYLGEDTEEATSYADGDATDEPATARREAEHA